MGDILSPCTIPAPPPPTSSPLSKNNSMTMLSYGLVVIGTAAIVLALYNIIIIKRCNRDHDNQSQPETPNRLVMKWVENRRLDNPQRNLLSSLKYKKEVVVKEGDRGVEDKHGGVDSNNDDYDYECPVCLSVYEEGEEVRKLPRCKHSFHALCIDMWLYSHFDCPICRTPVDAAFPVESSREGLMESRGISV